ncbi:TonB-dependent receptor [Pedobacter nutrimenti]|uniref:Iron complex outermembrane receptor protein n=1 Tax=Pedobacter nutrimenti TaxID=1241337 RepID=A0A318UFJ7_9SPHI|nr:TonB-dependent receptor [Pedobacter nutrimenti]PYF74941.1 iron complex outermembrane receptor protein [Pedobacter nutrimenti]
MLKLLLCLKTFRLYIFLFAFFGFQAVMAQTGSIKGKIRSNDGSLLSSVTVSLVESGSKVLSTAQGTYEITGIKSGTYKVTAKFVGMNVQTQTVKVREGEASIADFILTDLDNMLDGVEISSSYRRFGKKESDQVAKLPLKNLENPQVYHIVPKEILQEQVIVTYNDVLKNVTGVSQGLVNGSNSFYMRGFENRSLLRNGIQDNKDNSIEVANIESIEVLKGPSATLFGNSLTSFGGLINRVTKKPFDLFKGEISYTIGGYDLNRITADVNTPLNKEKGLLLRTNVAYYDEGSYMDAGFTKRLFIAPSLLYQVNDRLSISFDAEIYQQRANDFHRLFPENSFTKTNTESLDLNWRRYYHGDDLTESKPSVSLFTELNYKISDFWKSQTVLSQTKYSNTGYRVWNMINKDSVNRSVRYSNSNYNTIEVQQNFTGDFKIAGHRNRLVIGLDYYTSRSNENLMFATPFDQFKLRGNDPKYVMISKQAVDAFFATVSPVRNIASQSTYSAYFSDVFNITPDFMAMASLRVDHFRSGGSYDVAADTTTGKYDQTKLSPKLGLVYQLIPEKVSLFGNYMNGFANNAPVIQPDGVRNAFKPSNANQWELGFKINLLEGKLNSTFSYYDIKVNDMVRLDPMRAGFSIQDGGQMSRGFESELIANFAKGFNVIAGYAHNNAYTINTDADIDGLRQWTGPADIANLWVNYAFQDKLLKGVSLGIGGNYNSKNYISQSRKNGEFYIPAYTVLNAVAGYDSKTFRLSFKLDNLMNKVYWGSYVNQMMPRRFSVNVAVKI